MTQYPFPETKITKTLKAIFLFFLLYLARDTLVTSSILGFYKAQGCMLGLLGLTGGLFLWQNRKGLKAIVLDRRVGAMLLTAVIMLLPMAAKRDWQLMYFSVLICIFAAIFFSFFLSCREIAKYYVVILTVLGAYSVAATYVLRLLPDRGLLPVPVFHNQIGVDFYNFLLSFVSLSFVRNRNFGIFREPGVYQFFLILGLYLCQYTVQWKKEKTMWILSGILALTLVTTFATGGFVELGLLCIVVFFDKKLYRNKWVWVALAGLAVALGALAAYCIDRENALFWEVYDMLIGKFTYQEESIGDRVGSVVVNLQAFLGNPLFGSRISQVLYAIDNNTTSSLIMLAIFGLPGFLLHVAGWLALVWKKEQKIWVNGMLAVILFMSFNTQNLIADLFFWLFPIMALTERILPMLPKRKVQ